MPVPFRLDQCDKLYRAGAPRSMSLISQHQPVVPVPDLVLQLLQRLAHTSRFAVPAGGQFGDIARLFRSLAKIVQIPRMQRLHLRRQTRKPLESHHRRRLRLPAPQTPRSQRRLQSRYTLVKFRQRHGSLRFQLLSQRLSPALQPCVQLIRLLRQRRHAPPSPGCLQRWPGGNCIRHCLVPRVLPCFFRIHRSLRQLAQQLPMHIQIPHRPRRATNPLQHSYHRRTGFSHRGAAATLRHLSNQALDRRL